jgi:SLT domain-containing protein
MASLGGKGFWGQAAQMFGGAVRTVTQIFSGAGKVAKVLIDLAHGDTGAAGRALGDLIPAVKTSAAGNFASMLTRLPAQLIGSTMKFLVDRIKGFVSDQQGGGALPGGQKGTSAQVAGWIKQALSLTGAPAGWLGAMEILVNKESGGNTAARNPSGASGIAQLMPGTFAAYHMPGHGNIWNPVDNLIAGIRHLMAAWGSPDRIPGLLGGGNYKGYDGGGWLPPGLSLAQNLTGRPELVLNQDQLMTLSARSQGGNGSTYVAHFDGLTGAAIESHVRTAFQAMSIQQGSLQRQGRRS